MSTNTLCRHLVFAWPVVCSTQCLYATRKPSNFPCISRRVSASKESSKYSVTSSVTFSQALFSNTLPCSSLLVRNLFKRYKAALPPGNSGNIACAASQSHGPKLCPVGHGPLRWRGEWILWDREWRVASDETAERKKKRAHRKSFIERTPRGGGGLLICSKTLAGYLSFYHTVFARYFNKYY